MSRKTDIGELLSKSDGGGINFDDNLRINLLDNYFKPDKNFEFPGNGRSICLPCVLFSKNKENNFTKIPSFSEWYKSGEKDEEHCSSSVHDRGMSRLEEFKERFQNPQSTIPYSTDKTLQQRAEHNTEEVLKWIVEVVILCGKQCLPFIGLWENINDSSHNSEFLSQYSNYLAKQTKH